MFLLFLAPHRPRSMWPAKAGSPRGALLLLRLPQLGRTGILEACWLGWPNLSLIIESSPCWPGNGSEPGGEYHAAGRRGHAHSAARIGAGRSSGSSGAPGLATARNSYARIAAFPAYD